MKKYITCYLKDPKEVNFYLIVDDKQRGATIYKNQGASRLKCDLQWIIFLFKESGNLLLIKEKQGLKKNISGYALLSFETARGEMLSFTKDGQIIKEGSLKSVIDFLLKGKFLRSLGIDYQTKTFEKEEDFEEVFIVPYF